MKQLEISMAGEIKPEAEVRVRVLKRLLQAQGDLLEYNPLSDDYLSRVSNVFLCVDQTGPFTYMLNIVDGA